MASIIDINENVFAQEVLETKGAVLVDFWAPWCGYCTKLLPVLEDISAELGEQLKIVKLNVDDNRKLAEKQGVMSLPTMLLFVDGQQVERISGFMPKAALMSKLKPHL